MKQIGGGHETAPAFDVIQADVGKRLDGVAKILAGALVTVAGVIAALGLTSDLVFVALNNNSWPIFAASLCAILTIVCSIVAFLIHPTKRATCGRSSYWWSA
ncbi:hypothetical protein AB0F25_28980 [Streptomyces wedmorensis]|uniref:hypothetical protein n=1 Tax=Streptomyces wedmorensis TaxID=43759 RepID=UPI0034148552